MLPVRSASLLRTDFVSSQFHLVVQSVLGFLTTKKIDTVYSHGLMHQKTAPSQLSFNLSLLSREGNLQTITPIVTVSYLSRVGAHVSAKKMKSNVIDSNVR